MRSPARIENDCSHAEPRRAGADSLRSSVPPVPGRAQRPVGRHRDLERLAAQHPGAVGAQHVDGVGLDLGDGSGEVPGDGVGHGCGARVPTTRGPRRRPGRTARAGPARSGTGRCPAGGSTPRRARADPVTRGRRRAARRQRGRVRWPLAARRVGEDEADGAEAEVVHGVSRDPGLGGGTAQPRSGLGHRGRGYVARAVGVRPAPACAPRAEDAGSGSATVRAQRTTYRGWGAALR